MCCGTLGQAAGMSLWRTWAASAANAPSAAPYPVQRWLTRGMREEAQKVGDAERMQLWAGQSAKLARNEAAGTICEELWEEASRLLPH